MKIKIEKITIRHQPEENPDLSYLQTQQDKQGNIISSMRYTNEDIKKYGLKKVQQWINEDHKRLNDYGESWEEFGVIAEAQVSYSIGGNNKRIEWLNSGGLWGIESDSDTSYIKEIEQEQLDELKEHLKIFNIDTSNFKQTIIHTEED